MPNSPTTPEQSVREQLHRILESELLSYPRDIKNPQHEETVDTMAIGLKEVSIPFIERTVLALLDQINAERADMSLIELPPNVTAFQVKWYVGKEHGETPIYGTELLPAALRQPTGEDTLDKALKQRGIQP